MKVARFQKKAVVLLSGGIDSATVLYYAIKNNFDVTALTFDYQQRHKKELKFAKKISSINNIKNYLQLIDLSWADSSLVNSRKKIPCNRNLNSRVIPSTYVSGRNIIFLSYALSLAESISAKKIFIGAHIQDYSGYPDCRLDFLTSFQKAAAKGLAIGKIEISSPLINKSKKDIIKLGIKLEVPYQFTWSCYHGGRLPCKKCDSCRFRIKAFDDLGLIDPLLKN